MDTLEKQEDENLVADTLTSLAEVCRGQLQTAILDLPLDLVSMDESELIGRIKPSEILWGLRQRFWEHFNDVLNDTKLEVKVLHSSKIYNGVCCKRVWQKTLKNREAMAFICRPIKSMEEEFDLLAVISQSRMKELVRLSLAPEKDNFSASKAKIVLQTIAMIQNRKYGNTIQRNLSLSVKEHRKIQNKPKNVEALESEIKNLEKELGDTVDAEIVGE